GQINRVLAVPRDVPPRVNPPSYPIPIGPGGRLGPPWAGMKLAMARQPPAGVDLLGRRKSRLAPFLGLGTGREALTDPVTLILGFFWLLSYCVSSPPARHAMTLLLTSFSLS